MRMVIDTNIIVSALLSPHGAACKVLSDVMDGKYEVFVSVEIFQEYVDVLHRENLDLMRILLFICWTGSVTMQFGLK